MPIVDNIIGIVRDINDRKRAARVDEQLRTYGNDPQTAIANVMQIDPRTGMQLRDKYIADQAASRKARLDAFGLAAKMTAGMPEQDFGTQVDKLAPVLTNMFGLTPDEVGAIKTAGPNALAGLNEDLLKEIAKARYGMTVAPVGSHVLRDGKVIDRVPYATKPVVARGGDGSSTVVPFDPNTGQFITGPENAPQAPGQGAPISMTVDALRPHFVQQESRGNYRARNAETGALGAYQIMPATGRSLAKRLGLPWRPDMMAKDDPASRRYQDAIGGAAIQEAIDASGGDLATAAMYYHGGSNRDIWGPRTRRYASEIQARVGGGGNPQQSVNPYRITTPGRPGKSFRAATPDELAQAGYPEGTAAQVDQDGKFVNIKSPSAASAMAKAKWDAQTLDRGIQLVTAFESLRDKAQKVLNSPGLDGAVGSVQGRLPGWALGQDAEDARNDLDTLKRNIGLTALNQFKAMSAQGASGFGNLSNEEGKRLESLFGTLTDTSSEKVIRNTLREIIKLSDTAVARANASLNGRDWSKADPSTAARAKEATGGGAPKVGQVFRNPQTGKRIRWSGKGWESIN